MDWIIPHRIVARNFILRATPKCSSIAVEKFEEFWNGHFEIQVAAKNRVSMEHVHGEINASPFQVYLSQPGSSPFQTPVFIHIRDTVRYAGNELRVANQVLRNLGLELVTLSALPELTAFLELLTAPNAGVRGRFRILVTRFPAQRSARLASTLGWANQRSIPLNAPSSSRSTASAAAVLIGSTAPVRRSAQLPRWG